MGGPRAWKEAQKKQQEFQQGGWDEEPVTNNNEDEDNGEEGKDIEKRDVYAEYGIDPETANEKSQRAKGLGDTGEMPGQEDVSSLLLLRFVSVLTYFRNSQWL
jgi:Swi5-dependent recombination DNA repair protein 1